MSFEFTRNNIDHYLYLLAKEYKSINKNDTDCELILVGGSSILLNYNFRDTTSDIDSLIQASSSFKDAVRIVGEREGIRSDWINDDFKKTNSYSPKIIEHSKFYKRFCNYLNVRTVSDEYLVAMKLKSYRQYKNDISDIIGIIKESQERQQDLNIDGILNAYYQLYEENLVPEIKNELISILEYDDLEELYYNTKQKELQNKKNIIDKENLYPGIITKENVEKFLNKIEFSQKKGKEHNIEK